MKKIYKVGIIGCGNISDIYIENIKNKFANIEVMALCNRTKEKAIEKAKKYQIAYVWDWEEMLTSKEIDIVVILTSPDSHYELVKQALQHKKHTYVEKPIALENEQAYELQDIAKKNHCLLGCAPDTFLGAAVQTAKKWIDSGKIGRIVAATAFVTCRGHENWHPDPAFFYKKGAGPMLDMGPYYITPLLYLCGDAKEVIGMTSRAFDTRIVGSKPHKGEKISVEIDTHVTGCIRFENGAVATVMASFDIVKADLSFIEIHGTKGSLKLPCPNMFGGDVFFCGIGENEYKKIPYAQEMELWIENDRGLGVADLAGCIESGTVPKTDASLAVRVLEIMNAFYESSETGKKCIL